MAKKEGASPGGCTQGEALPLSETTLSESVQPRTPPTELSELPLVAGVFLQRMECRYGCLREFGHPLPQVRSVRNKLTVTMRVLIPPGRDARQPSSDLTPTRGTRDLSSAPSHATRPRRNGFRPTTRRLHSSFPDTFRIPESLHTQGEERTSQKPGKHELTKGALPGYLPTLPWLMWLNTMA